jgi:glyoxylase-like metal-dependent hydrolase (beta-lactamase superfamily II)
MNGDVMTKPEVEAFFDEATFTVSYVVTDPRTKACALIDSVLDYDAAAGRTSTDSAERMIAYVREHGLTPEWIIDTHVHADHLSAAPYLKDRLGGRMGIGEHITTVQEVFGKVFNAGTAFQCDGSQFDHLFRDGESYTLGDIACRAIHTPGHTPACMTHVIGDAAFVGDTIFMPDFGTARCDFPGGDARALFRSIQRIFELPDETRLFMCHDYGTAERKEYRWESTVAEEKAKNVHVREGVSEDDFAELRTSRDRKLSMPRLIIPSVQVNMRAGHMPPAEDNGTVYLKVPLNKL